MVYSSWSGHSGFWIPHHMFTVGLVTDVSPDWGVHESTSGSGILKRGVIPLIIGLLTPEDPPTL